MAPLTNLKNRLEDAWRPLYLWPLILVGGLVAYVDAKAYQGFQQLSNPGEAYQAVETVYSTPSTDSCSYCCWRRRSP